jgi:uncharacterized damage-inducible protein DinB
LVERWNQVAAWQREFLSGQNEADLDRVIEFTLGGGPKQAQRVGDLLQHAVLHGVHHRGQVALLLRMLGAAPENFDYLFYPGTTSR